MEHESAFPEPIARRILARAVELDHIRADSLSLTELRGIAAEVGVSESALEQALREQRPAVAVAGLRSRIPLAAIGTAACVAGAVGGIVDVQTSFMTSPLVMGLFMMGAGGVSVTADYREPVRGWRRFQLGNALLWGGYSASWLITAFAGGAVAGSIETFITLRVIGFGWALSAAFGSVAALLHARRARTAAGGGTGIGALPLRKRIGERLKSWIDTLTARVRVAAGTTG